MARPVYRSFRIVDWNPQYGAPMWAVDEYDSWQKKEDMWYATTTRHRWVGFRTAS